MKNIFVIALFLSVCAPALASLTSPFKNLDQVVSNVKLGELLTPNQDRKLVRIAIFDNGFKNFELEVGRSLPTSTTFHAGPVVVPETQLEPHGTAMAQIVAGILDQASGGQFAYEIHLYSAFGYSNLSAAVNDAISKKVDVILYSQVWEYGGFGGGHGFINQLANRATSSGILWINAAGNFAQGTYQTQISPKADGWLTLAGDNDSVRVRCEASSACHLRMVLSWNDFSDDVTVGTDKDLDLILLDSAQKTVRASTLRQQKDFPDGQQGLSKYPRELIETDVQPGTYFARVQQKSNNFGRSDQLRMTVSGDGITLIDRTRESDPLNPADNPNVITVGASDSDLSSNSLNGAKPEVRLPSLIELSSGEEYKGSSNSAAMFAAYAAAYRSLNPSIKRDQILARWNGASSPQPPPQPQPPAPSTPNAQAGQGFPLFILNFKPTGPGCFIRTQVADAPLTLQQVLNNGGVAVKTSAGTKVFVNVDPVTVIYGVQRLNVTDMVVVGDTGNYIYPRNQDGRLPQRFFEVVQFPEGETICQ